MIRWQIRPCTFCRMPIPIEHTPAVTLAGAPVCADCERRGKEEFWRERAKRMEAR